MFEKDMHSLRYTLRDENWPMKAFFENLPGTLLTGFPAAISGQSLHLAFSAFDIQRIKGDKEIKHHNLQRGDYGY